MGKSIDRTIGICSRGISHTMTPKLLWYYYTHEHGPELSTPKRKERKVKKKMIRLISIPIHMQTCGIRQKRLLFFSQLSLFSSPFSHPLDGALLGKGERPCTVDEVRTVAGRDWDLKVPRSIFNYGFFTWLGLALGLDRKNVMSIKVQGKSINVSKLSNWKIASSSHAFTMILITLQHETSHQMELKKKLK